MQRQSLGSPTLKLEIVDLNKEEKRFSPATTSAKEDIKAEKSVRSNPKSERSIHLVPIVILLCFTILYVFSHQPSTEELSSFGGFSGLLNHKGVRIHRALKEAGRIRHRRMGPP